MNKTYCIAATILLFITQNAMTYASLNPPEKEKQIMEKWKTIQSISSAEGKKVRFTENLGQVADSDLKPAKSVFFKASAPGMNIYITENGLSYIFSKTVKEKKKEDVNGISGKEKKTILMSWINLRLSGASIKQGNISREGESEESFNYFYPHCPRGIYGVKEYEKITIREVYPGIDWIIYGADEGMKYDFVVHPGADPSVIKLLYESENPISMDPLGNLHLSTSIGSVTEQAPFCYLKENGNEIPSKYILHSIDKHHTEVSYDLSRTPLPP